MLAVVEKADDRTRAERLLLAQEEAVRVSFLRFVASAGRIDLADVSPRGIELILRRLDLHIENFARAVNASFVDAASAETAALGTRLTMKATASIKIAFDPGDKAAAELMQQNKLRLVSGLTAEQRGVVRQALVSGMQRGLGTRDMARLFQNSVGLTSQQQQSLQAFERALIAGRQEELALPSAERGPVNSPAHIARLVTAQRDQLLAARAETIARTESLRIVSQARDEATRQSMRATGQRAELAGKEWAASHDARTRQAHADRDGARRRLNEPFAPGVMLPGDGGPAEAINCRCTPLYEFFDTEAELQAWLAGGS